MITFLSFNQKKVCVYFVRWSPKLPQPPFTWAKKGLIVGVILQPYFFILPHPLLGCATNVILSSFQFESLLLQGRGWLDDGSPCGHGCSCGEGHGFLLPELRIYSGCFYLNRWVAKGTRHQHGVLVQRAPFMRLKPSLLPTPSPAPSSVRHHLKEKNLEKIPIQGTKLSLCLVGALGTVCRKSLKDHLRRWDLRGGINSQGQTPYRKSCKS